MKLFGEGSLKRLAIALVFCASTIAAAEDPAPDEIPLPTPAAPAQAAPAQGAPIAAPPAAETHAQKRAKLMDVNTASLEDLMSLPGMSERLASQVIAGRPYRSRVDLKTRGIVPTRTYDAILERIVAKSPKLTAK